MVAVKQALRSISMQRLTVQISAEQPTKALPALMIIASSSGASQKTKKQWLDEGNAHYNAKRYQEALASFEQAIQLDPNFVVAYHNKAFVLERIGKSKEAQLAREKARQLCYSK